MVEIGILLVASACDLAVDVGDLGSQHQEIINGDRCDEAVSPSAVAPLILKPLFVHPIPQRGIERIILGHVRMPIRALILVQFSQSTFPTGVSTLPHAPQKVDTIELLYFGGCHA